MSSGQKAWEEQQEEESRLQRLRHLATVPTSKLDKVLGDVESQLRRWWRSDAVMTRGQWHALERMIDQVSSLRRNKS